MSNTSKPSLTSTRGQIASASKPGTPGGLSVYKQLDQALQGESLSAEADRRILAAMKVARAAQSAKSVPAFRYGWAIAVVALLVLVGGGLSMVSQQLPQQGVQMGGLLVVRGSVIFAPDLSPQQAATLQCETHQCRLRFSERRTQIILKQQAKILRIQQKLKLVRGVATFDVAPRRRPELPLHIQVSHGLVEVLGTRFTIQQGARGGHLLLHRGRVRFYHQDGPTRELRAGERVSWPLRDASSQTKRAYRKHSRLLVPRLSPVKPPAASAQAPEPLRVARTKRPTRRLATAMRRQPAPTSPQRPPAVIEPVKSRMVRPRPVRARALVAHPAKLPTATAPTAKPHPTVTGHQVAEPHTTDGGAAAPFHPSGMSDSPQSRTPQSRVPQIRVPQIRVPRRRRPLLKVAPRVALTQWIQELAQLRSQGQYALAAQQLRQHLQLLQQQPPSPGLYATRERLHYELGLLLSHYLSQPAKACRHWREHQRFFIQSTRYRQEVRSLLRQLKCN